MVKYLNSISFSFSMKLIDHTFYSNKDGDIGSRKVRISEYRAAYAFDDNINKIVTVHTQHNYGGGYHGFLQMQKVGLFANLESICFLDGKPYNYATQFIDKSDMLLTSENYGLLGRDRIVMDKFLEKFGQEFKSIFEKDERVKESLSTHFTSMMPYLK